ncbi:PREDICTED: uncharacterized protein LOC108977711 isoform X2 [Bactrocera latifrons]|uniref:uncharacterized protein LOC108977711 isoform X2 n=1 Tax=Bactrocera latifrons TaxID=174628 RepID=UPI0008DCE0DF|nr:PREDICTED: uncharacterized protein LOC108977711 isoform X2 [Bactrocera latifrons]
MFINKNTTGNKNKEALSRQTRSFKVHLSKHICAYKLNVQLRYAKSCKSFKQKLTNKMILKVPSNDWSDQFEYVVEEDDSLSDLEDEQDFSEYLWMENEEEFDKNELKRLEEEDIMKECFEAMLEDELEAELAEWQKAKYEIP